MNYTVSSLRPDSRNEAFEDEIILVKDYWDDYNYKTSFDMYYKKNFIGALRILHLNEMVTSDIIPNDFKKLDNEFISIGYDASYYENMIELFGKEKSKIILENLNDITITKLKNSDFSIKHPGIQNSLFRSSNARYLYEEAYNKYFSNNTTTDRDYKFIFKAKYNEEFLTDIELDFKKHSELPNRLFAIIGKNGVGKTRFLNQLSECLYDSSKKENIGRFIVNGEKEIPAFQKIIAISFSAFDNFFKGDDTKGSIDETKKSNYTYIGLSNTKNKLYSSKELIDINSKNFDILKEKNRSEEFIKLISMSNILNKTQISDYIKNKDVLFDEKYSSGQKIFISMLCRLLSEIDTGSLVFLDEPELYLHPNAIASLMKIFSSVLEKYQSYAILCTHSPILIQEIPSRYVRKLILIDNNVEQTNVSMETFGANVSDINKEIFNVSENESLYKSTLKKLSEKLSEEEINDLFDDDLSMKASMYLSRLFLEKNK